ncbi:MAG TPA: adenylate/guanylate cyclase domain-containing protein [Spirochaetota bacterium]|nr:adenylate/guanylate cyclase domain-containing protein [Spirochaetota bacterium]HRX48519.1 adenylate/guanylate cyclase domain-containing protein [Spirochaetota bacterium]
MRWQNKPALFKTITFRVPLFTSAVLITALWGMLRLYSRGQENMVLTIFLYAIIIITAISFITLFTRYYLTRRIIALGRVIKGTADGDFVSKIDINSDDEIGELGNEINSMIDGLRERFMFSRFVSKSALQSVKGEIDIDPAGEKKNLTVLFTDMRNFTEYAETRNPETVMEMLNTVMSLQARIIHKNNGEIYKYSGHEIMAVFGGKNMVLRAAKSAEEIRDEIKKINETSVTPLYASFGINTGEMIAGNMGSIDRADRTVIGTAVNTGARLCAAAGRNTIVVSEKSQSYISDKAEFIEHEPLKVKGKDGEVKIYTLVKTL